MNKKYELLKDESITISGRTLFRIKALKSFNNVKIGDIGGYVESEYNLSHEGNCWIYNNAKVYEVARVIGNALVFNNVKIHGSAFVSQNVKIHASCEIYGAASIFDRAVLDGCVIVKNSARIFGNAALYGNAIIKDSACISGNAIISGRAEISGIAVIEGTARVTNTATVTDQSCVTGNAFIGGNAKIHGYAKVSNESQVYGNAEVFGHAKILAGKVHNFGKVSEFMHIKYSKCSTDLSLKENLADNIRCQTNLPVLSDKKGDYVLGFKHVKETLEPNVFRSGYDYDFKYYLGLRKEVKDPNMSNKSCVSGIHFSNLSYWEDQSCDTVIQVKCYLEDIITVQEGKIRCKKLLPLTIVKNGIS